ARSINGDGSGFDGWRRLAVGDDLGRGADAAHPGLGCCTGQRTGDPSGGPGTIPRDRGALLASGCGEALDDCGDQRSAVTSEGGIGTAEAGGNSDASDCGTAEGIYEMALLAGVGGAGCACDLSDCETENTRPADGSEIDAGDAGGGGRKPTVRH